MANKNLTIAISLTALQAKGCFALAGKLVGLSMPPAFSSLDHGSIMKRFEERNPFGDYQHPHRVGRSVVITTIAVRTRTDCYQQRLSQHTCQTLFQKRQIWQSSTNLMLRSGCR